MPHQCTNCGRAFPDGSKEMLSGCPDCGGNKFQFHPGSIDDLNASSDPDPAPNTTPQPDPTDSRQSGSGESSPPESPETTTDSTQTTASDSNTQAANAVTEDTPQAANAVTEDSAQAANAVKEDSTQAANAIKEDSTQADNDVKEDSAQASARSDVVSPGELEAAKATPPEGPPSNSAVDDGDADRPDIEELRNELNEQFESIKILNPGQYEINLMELYDRDEYIISLREDGRYVIEVPDAWGVTDRE